MTARTLLLQLALGASIVAAAPSVSAAQAGGTSLRQFATTLPAAPAVGPRRDAAVSGVRLQVTDAPLTPVVVAPRSRGRGQTLAIVGGAAFLGGLIIGDDVGTVIAVGGLGVGIYGLWLWLSN